MTSNELKVKANKHINEATSMPLDVTGSLQKGPKRSGKFYFKNEKEVMKRLGLDPVPGSGSGWIYKEDGESETILAQLKSTDKDSYRIQSLDLQKLEVHANTANKIPVFIVQFLNRDKIYLIVEAENIEEFFNAFVKEEKPNSKIAFTEVQPLRKKISSSSKARNKFYKEKEEAWQKKTQK